MSIYTVIEKQNSASQREGVTIEAKNLTQAKRKATKMQAFHGTVMAIEDANGNTVAAKERDGSWVNQSCFD